MYHTETLGVSKRTYILGEIQNQTTAVVQVTQVHADLRNAAGHIIGTASKGLYLPMLRPGERSPFKIAADLPPTFDRYSIRINFEPGDEQPLAPLRVQNDTVYRVEDMGEIRWLYIFGEVPDDLSTSVQDLLVAATLYDEDDQVAYVAATDEDHSSAYLSALSPGQRSPFRLSLHPLTYDHVGWTVAYQMASQAPEVGQLVVSSSDFIESASDSLFVFGEVANTTPQNIRSVRVVGTCYDVAGAVVNAASANLRSGFRTVLAPGKKAPFLLDLSAGPSAYDNRTLSVTYESAPDDATTAWAIPSFSQYHEQEQNGGILLEWMDLFGEVRNEDQQDIRSVRVIATFYDEAGTVVNNALAPAYRKRIEAGGKSPFKLTVNFGPLDWENVDWTVDYQTASGGSLPELRATNVQCSEAGGVLVIRGDVKNIGTQTVTSAEVYVTLYDAEETVINATRAVLDSALEPRASVPFEVRFSQHFEGCDNYEVQIDG